MMPTRRSAYVGFRVDVRLRRGVPPGSDFLGGLLTVMLEGCVGVVVARVVVNWRRGGRFMNRDWC